MSKRVVPGDRVDKKVMAVWIAILVLTGTYFRNREWDTIPTTDWLVVLQVLGGILGIAIGIVLIKKHRCGLGGKAFLAFVFAAAVSALFSPHWVVVLGYWIVLAGAYLLTVGIVGGSKRQEALDEIERVCFLAVSAILLKDCVIALAFPGPDAADSELFRLGMGFTHPNLMSVLSAIAFWMSFRDDDTRPRSRFLLWPARCLFIAIIVLSRTRIAMIGLVIAGIVRSTIRYRCTARARGYPLLVAIPCWLLVGIMLWVLAGAWNIQVVENVNRAFSRGQDAQTVASISGRTEIWTYALEKISDAPLPQLLFGHGFGMSRFVLNDGYGATEFFVSHAHNALLETVLSMGLFGAIPFGVTVLYGLFWMTGFVSLQDTFSLKFSLRAVSVLSIILIASVTEPFLGGKLGPVAMIYVFYVTALDQHHHIASAEDRSCSFKAEEFQR